MITFTHQEEEEEEEEVARAAEEEKYNNDDNKEEEEVKQHDEKHEDVKKEEAEEEERKCRARRVYLGHLRLHPHWPPPLAASPSLPLSLSPPSPRIVHPLTSAARCLFQSSSAGLDANGCP